MPLINGMDGFCTFFLFCESEKRNPSVVDVQE
jgi:hypothetical protein